MNPKKKNKKRIWIPVKRADKFQDKRTKRKRTRATQLKSVLKEQL